MIPRTELVKFIIDQLENLSDERYEKKYRRTHYGLVELRDLLDFIYGEEPKTEEEYLNTEGRTKQ